MMPASKTIRNIRNKVMLDQSQFGKLVGVTGAAIGHYERGQRIPRFPVIRKLMDIAKKNGITVKVEDFLT